MSDETTSFEDVIVPIAVAFFRNHPDLPNIQEVREILVDYLCDHNLVASLSNFEYAFQACQKDIERSLSTIPASRWLNEVVKPEFAKRQAAQPAKPKSSKPWGVSTSQWIHNS